MSTRALLIVFALVLLFATPSTAQIENWVTVSPPLAAFLIKMPGQPEKKVEERRTHYTYKEHPKSSKSLFIEVGVVNLPFGAVEAEATLRKEIEDFAKVFEGKIVSTARHDYKKDSPMKQAFPGIEAKVTSEGSTCLLAVYLISPKEYMTTYCAANERYSQAEAERFLNSFVVLRY
jgi:hypothetical protein